jgi:hypothetical protein
MTGGDDMVTLLGWNMVLAYEIYITVHEKMGTCYRTSMLEIELLSERIVILFSFFLFFYCSFVVECLNCEGCVAPEYVH